MVTLDTNVKSLKIMFVPQTAIVGMNNAYNNNVAFLAAMPHQLKRVKWHCTLLSPGPRTSRIAKNVHFCTEFLIRKKYQREIFLTVCAVKRFHVSHVHLCYQTITNVCLRKN